MAKKDIKENKKLDLELQHKIVEDSIDVNNQELFISSMFKAFLYQLNKSIKLRNKIVPHFMLNTGDDIMYLERKGQKQSKEPLEQTNEDFIYNSVPRCIVDFDTIEVLEDQITNPYVRGNFDIEYKKNTYGFNAEFRRMPLKLSVSLKYYLDNFNDTLAISQYIITKMLFIQTFSFAYMGQTIQASYKVPTSFQGEKNVTFDGGTTEQKLRTISLTLEIETNMPVYNNRTAVCNAYFIQQTWHDVDTTDDGTFERLTETGAEKDGTKFTLNNIIKQNEAITGKH